MEYLANKNINELLRIRQKLNKRLEEEELWNIFFQCIMALLAIHKKGIIHRDLNPNNIFLDDNMKIKIGDFGISTLDRKKIVDQNIKYIGGEYILEEYFCKNTNIGTDFYKTEEIRNKNNYDQRVDVYALGKTFYEIAFLHRYSGEITEEDKKLYSQSLIDIISLMLEKNQYKRLSSENIYEKMAIEYSKISKNSSFDAMITCLKAFSSLNNCLKDNNCYNQDNLITNAYIPLIDINSDDEKWENSFNNLRKKLGLQNLKLEGTKEIEPDFLFEYLLKVFFDETVKIKYIAQDNKKDNDNDPHLINAEKSFQPFHAKEARIKFDNFFEKYDSPIIKNFKGLIKQTNTCNNCKVKTFSFSSYFYVNFNLKEILDVLEEKETKKIDLENIFKTNNKFTDKLLCYNCLKKTEHTCTKQFYSFPNLLVIYIQRENIKKDKVEISIKEDIKVITFDLDLKKYKLVGLISKIDKDNKDSYLSKVNYNDKWYFCQKYRHMVEIKSPEEKIEDTDKEIEEDTIMFFYTSI